MFVWRAGRLLDELERAFVKHDEKRVRARGKIVDDHLKKSAESGKKEPGQEIKAAGSSRVVPQAIEKILRDLQGLGEHLSEQSQPETAEGMAQSFITKPETVTYEQLAETIIAFAQSPMTVDEALRSIKAKPKAAEALEDLARAVQAKKRPQPMTFEGTGGGHPRSW